MISDWIFTTGCAAVAWAGFCRLTRTDTATRLAVRAAFYALTMAAVLGVASVLLWGYSPGWPSAALAVATAFVQAAASPMWHQGVPRPYLTEPGALDEAPRVSTQQGKP
jgi:hypothetical protein